MPPPMRPEPCAEASPGPDEAEADALAAIVRGRWAWVSQIYLLAAGHDLATLQSLVAKGLAVSWEWPATDPSLPFPTGLTMTLTPYGAESLGVEIEEVGPSERNRWARIRYDERGRRTDAGKPPVRAFRYESRLRLPELVPDTAPGPEYLVDEESGEEVRVFAGGRESGAGRSTLKGGIGGDAWSRGVPVLKDKRLKGKKK